MSHEKSNHFTIGLKRLRQLRSAAPAALLFLLAACTNHNNRIPVDPAVETGVLNNGLTWIVKENKLPGEQASLRLAVKTGSIHEAEDQLGLAHFVEHMAFNGTRSFPRTELIDFLEKMGIAFGPELNAYTSYDRTVYKLEVPLDQAENLPTAVRVLRDWADGLLMDEGEIDRERGVVVQEWRDGLGAAERLRSRYLPILFKDSIFAKRRPIGEPEVIQTAPYQRVRDFYSEWYTPDRMAVIAVGDFNSSEVKSLIRSEFDSMQPPKNKKTVDKTIPDQNGTEVVILPDPEAEGSSLWMINRLPPSEGTPYSRFKEELLNLAADRIITNRMDSQLNSGSEGIIESYAGLLNLVTSRPFYLTGLDFDGTAFSAALTAWAEELTAIRLSGATESELSQAVAEVTKQLEVQAREKDKIQSPSKAATYIDNFLNEEAIADPDWIESEGRSLLDKISLIEVNSRISDLLVADNRACIIITPQSEVSILPSDEEINQILKNIDRNASENEQTITHQAEIQEESAPVSLQYSPEGKGGIVKVEKMKNIGTERWLLSNGAEVLVRPSDLTENRYIFKAVSLGGTSLADDELFPSAELADDMIAESGIANLSRAEKQLWFSRTGTSAVVRISELGEEISGSGESDELEEGIKLLAAGFTEINPQQEAFIKASDEVLTAARHREKDPRNFFSRSLNQILRKKGKRYPELTESQVNESDFMEAKRFADQRFADASDFTFIFAGKINKRQLKKLAARYLATLPSDNDRDNKENFKRRYSTYPTKDSSHVFRRGMEDQALIYSIYHREAEVSQLEELKIQAAAACLDRILDKEIREAESGTYSISSFAWTVNRPYREMVGGIVFSCIPERRRELESKRDQLLAQFLTGDFDPQLLKNFQKIRIGEYRENLEKDQWWLSRLEQLSFKEISTEEILNFEATVNSLTMEEITTAANALYKQGSNTRAVLLSAE